MFNTILGGLLSNEAIQQILTGAVSALAAWVIALIRKKKTVKKLQSFHESAMLEKDQLIDDLKSKLNGKA